MDKEPIMIDGVDVSVCEAYSKHREQNSQRHHHQSERRRK